MQRVGRIIFAGAGGVIIAALLVLVVARFVAVPIGAIVVPLEALIEARFTGGVVDIKDARLRWSQRNHMFALDAGRIDIIDDADAHLELSRVSVMLSGTALWQHARLAVAEVDIAQLDITPSDNAHLPPSLTVLLPDFENAGAGGNARFLNMINVRDITIAGYRSKTQPPSHILTTRSAGGIALEVNIAYQQPRGESLVVAEAYWHPQAKSHAHIELVNVNPQDIGHFSNLLTPLQGIQLPVTAQIDLAFDAQGQSTVGEVNLFVAPGQVMLSGTPLAVDEFTVAFDIDFAAQRFMVRDTRFNVAGVAGKFVGLVDYHLSAAGQLTKIDFDVDATGVRADVPRLFPTPIVVSHAKALMSFDMASRLLTIDRATAMHNFGSAELTGAVELAARKPHFDFTTKFSEMSRDAAMQFWPLPIAPKVRDWVAANLIGGDVLGGTLRLNASLDELINRERGTPLREDALRLDLMVDNVGLRYLKNMPPLEKTRANMSLRGKTFRVTTQGGHVLLPTLDGDTRAASVERVRFFMANFRDAATPTEINASGTGAMRDIIRTVNRSFKVTDNIDFDLDRLRGDAKVNFVLSLPILPQPKKRDVTFRVDAVTRGFSIDDKLGRFTLSDGQAMAHIDNAGMDITGRVKVNGAATSFAWAQPFGADGASKSKFSIQGMLQPQEVADLGQEWIGTRYLGDMHAHVLVQGPLNQPTGVRIFGDLTQSELRPYPFAYTKPVGVPSYVRAVIENNAKGKAESIRARLSIDGEEDIAAQIGLDGSLITRFEMTPMSLGRDKNVKATVRREGETRYVTLSAEQFDVAGLLKTGESEIKTEPKVESREFDVLPYLGDDMVVEGEIENIVGGHGEILQATRLRVVRQNGVHEKIAFEGVFEDGTPLIGTLDRDGRTQRAFTLQSENAGNILRLLDLQKEIYGGALQVQGQLYDFGRNAQGERRDLEGQVTMLGFRARNVPILASMLTLASLSGIADTLAGEGIKFRELAGDFSVIDGRLNIDGGLAHGPAVGITVEGDYDLARGDIDIGGTLIPAYALNSFLGNVPVLGSILTSRKGEGVVGIGYRMVGEDGKANIQVNPLSVLTPGVLRRIFELGIGLEDEDDAQIPLARDAQ